MMLAVGKCGKDAAAQVERLVVNWSRFHPGDLIVFPIDVRFHRAVSTQNEAVVLGCAVVLVKPPAEYTVSCLRFPRGRDNRALAAHPTVSGLS